MVEPKVSIIIPTHNRPQFLAKAVESALRQDYSNIEVVVVDDGSTMPLDVKSDARLLIVRNEKPLGGAGARNVGIKSASGEFISFLDDDDWLLADKISKQLECIKKLEADAVFSQILIRTQNQEIHYPILQEPFTKEVNLIRFNLIHTNATLIKRSVAESLMFDDSFEKYQDTDFHLRLVEQYHVAYLPGVVAVWNFDQRPDQITSSGMLKDFNNFLRLIEKHRSQIAAVSAAKRRYFARLCVAAWRVNRFDVVLSSLPSAGLFSIPALATAMLLDWGAIRRLRARFNLTLNRI